MKGTRFGPVTLNGAIAKASTLRSLARCELTGFLCASTSVSSEQRQSRDPRLSLLGGLLCS